MFSVTRPNNLLILRIKTKFVFQVRSSSTKPRDQSGVPADGQTAAKLKKMKKKAQLKAFNNRGKSGESDRHIAVKLPKHLFAGKRGIGKADRR